MNKKKPLLIEKSNQTALEIHHRISFALFANMKRYIRMNRLAEDLELNWRTVEKTLELMTNNYRERRKLEGKKSE